MLYKVGKLWAKIYFWNNFIVNIAIIKMTLNIWQNFKIGTDLSELMALWGEKNHGTG